MSGISHEVLLLQAIINRYTSAHFELNGYQVRHPRCVDRITSNDKCSQTQLLIFVLLRGVST